MSLIIGIDAKPLTRPLVGIGRYVHEITRHMAKDSAHRFILYSPGPLAGDYFSGLSNVEICHANITSRAGRQLWAQTLLPRWAARDKVDVLWCPAHGIPLLLPAHIPAVVTIHDLVWRHAPQTMRPLGRLLDSVMMPRAIARADRILTVSESTARDVASEVPAAQKKIRAIPLAGNFAENVAEVPLPFGKDYFLFVGTLEPRKNLPNLLAAYALLEDDIKRKHRLLIVGGRGWGGVDAAELVAQYGLSSQVDIAGWLDNAALQAAYKNAFALVMPSLYEGFGLPIVESLQCGVPVITSNISSMPEVAGAGGLLVNPHDPQDIAGAMRCLAGDAGLYTSLAAAGKTHAQCFSWERTASRTLAVLLEAAGRIA